MKDHVRSAYMQVEQTLRTIAVQAFRPECARLLNVFLASYSARLVNGFTLGRSIVGGSDVGVSVHIKLVGVLKVAVVLECFALVVELVTKGAPVVAASALLAQRLVVARL